MKTFHGIRILRAAAAFGIVGCHLNLGGGGITHFCDMNVVLFGAISGFLMAFSLSGGKAVSFGGYSGKRFRRLLPPYLVWSAVFLLATVAFDLVLDGGAVNPRFHDWRYWIAVVFLGSSACHLWFLIDLLYCQLILAFLWFRLPLFGRSFFPAAALAVLSILAASFCKGWFFLYPVRLFGSVCLGMALYFFSAKFRFSRGVLLAGVLATMAVHVAFPGIPAFVRDFLCAVPILLLFADCGEVKIPVGSKWLEWSMGVYLAHPLFARGMGFAVHKFLPGPCPAWAVLSDWLLVYLFSLGFARILGSFRVTARFVR